MTADQRTTRTPDYDPRLNSSIINFLLFHGIDGGFKKESLICSSDESLHTKSISLGQFPLYSESARKRAGVLCILVGLIGIGFIVLAALSLLSLAISIPIAVISILFSFITATMFIKAPEAQHRYVFVELECKLCEEGHSVLYDAITKQKRRRFGRYTNPNCVSLEVSSEKLSYECIEKAFEEMPSRLGHPFAPGAYNCKDWADELYAKIS